MAVTAASTLPAGYCKIGPQEFGDDVPARCVVTVEVKSKVKLDKKAVDGKSDGTTTNKGREPADVDIKLTWNRAALNPDGSSVDAAVEEALYQISPRGPNTGQPLDVGFKRSRVHGVDSMIVEEVDGPKDEPGTDLTTATIKGASWAKPSQAGQGAAKTPDDAQGADGTAANKTITVKGFGGDPNNTVTIPGAPSTTPTPPMVKP
jgi:hypothetical protein